jgi:hypothetical protein
MLSTIVPSLIVTVERAGVADSYKLVGDLEGPYFLMRKCMENIFTSRQYPNIHVIFPHKCKFIILLPFHSAAQRQSVIT